MFSVIKPLPSISLFKYHEASHHPVCTIFHNSGTIFFFFFTGSFSEFLATCGKINTKQSSLLGSSWWQWAWLSPKHCPCTEWAWVLGEYCLVFCPWLKDLWVVVYYWECCCQVFFSAHHLMPIMLFHVTSHWWNVWICLLSLTSLSSNSILHFSSVSILKKLFSAASSIFLQIWKVHP